MTQDKGIKLGLTGGMGCGKSTVAGIFKEAGFQTILTDDVVRKLLKDDRDLHAALRERWGNKLFTTTGEVDRQQLAEQVFGDESALRWLETQLHPRVREHWTSALRQTPAANWIVEIPLLFEKSLEKHFDTTICVSCSMQTIMARLEQKGFTPDQISKRMSKQLPLEEKEKRADLVISNDGSFEFLQQQVTDILLRLTS